MKVQVREVSQKGPSSLIEWTTEDQLLQRASLPSSELRHEDGALYVDHPELGAPYGEMWEDLVQMVMAYQVASLLRQRGIWTYEDFLKNTAVVNGVFREACADSYQQFVNAVHSRQRVREGRKE